MSFIGQVKCVFLGHRFVVQDIKTVVHALPKDLEWKAGFKCTRCGLYFEADMSLGRTEK